MNLPWVATLCPKQPRVSNLPLEERSRALRDVLLIAVFSALCQVICATVPSRTATALAATVDPTGRVPARPRAAVNGSSFIYTVAGNATIAGYSGDGALAVNAQLNEPNASVLDAAGNLYFTDEYNNVVRKVTAATGVITTIAGNGIAGYSGDNGPATSAELASPTGLAIDGAGNLYICDTTNAVVREIASNGIITTIAGNGTAGYAGDGGQATSAEMYSPWAIVIDSAGDLFIADVSYSVVRKISIKTGIITAFAGNASSRGYSGDGGPATAAALQTPEGLAIDSGGNLYIADSGNNVIRKVDAITGVITTVAGNASLQGYTGDGGPATSAELNYPTGVAVDSAGNIYIADASNYVVRTVAAANGTISTLAGSNVPCPLSNGDGGPASHATFCEPLGVTVDGTGNLYIVDGGAARVRLVLAANAPPAMQTAAPTFSVPPDTYATPQTVTVTDRTPGAAIYITLDGSTPTAGVNGYLGPLNVSGGMTIKAIAAAPGYTPSAVATASYTITAQPPAVIRTVAGDGVAGSSDGGGVPADAQLGDLAGMAFDHSGDLFFVDSTNCVVWELAAKTGLLSSGATVCQAGAGAPPAPGSAGIAIDSAGNLFVADLARNVVWKVAVGTGVTTIYAGNEQPYIPGTGIGDGGPATSAYIPQPSGLALDNAGNLYISQSQGLVRLVSASTGIITTVAGVGNGMVGSRADNIPATSANVENPGALALDSSGNLYIAQPIDGRVRKVTLSTGIITTVAGNGDGYGSSGDGGLATQAEVSPAGLAFDSAGNLYISDPTEIRKVSQATGIISSFAGNRYYGYSGDSGSATDAEVSRPQGIAFDASGNLFLADRGNYRIREVSRLVTPEITVTPSAASISTTQPLTVTVTVTGATGGSTPTGSVMLASGSYSAQQNLAGGSTTFGLAPGSLPTGSNTLTATYSPDNASAGSYLGVKQTTTVTITNPIGSATATITLTPSVSTVTDQQSVTVVAAVAGSGGLALPTGSITLAGGSYSSQQALANGGTSFTIPAGSLTAGANTLTASYSGDTNYSTATGTTAVTVMPLVIMAANPSAVAPGTAATATVTLSAGSTYSGAPNLTCTLAASPANAQSVPTCALNPASVTVAAGGKATALVTVSTTAGSNSSAFNQRGDEGILALGLLVGTLGLRRRKAALLLVACGIAILGCAGGGGGTTKPTPPPATAATSPGGYTFAVTATDASNTSVTASVSLTVTVQ